MRAVGGYQRRHVAIERYSHVGITASTVHSIPERIERPGGPFKCAHRGICVYPGYEKIAVLEAFPKELFVAWVEKVPAAIHKSDAAKSSKGGGHFR